MDVEVSLHDFKLQRPKRGLSAFRKNSIIFLNIIFLIICIGGYIFKWVFGFEEAVKWASGTTPVTNRTLDWFGFLDTGFCNDRGLTEG